MIKTMSSVAFTGRYDSILQNSAEAVRLSSQTPEGKASLADIDAAIRAMGNYGKAIQMLSRRSPLNSDKIVELLPAEYKPTDEELPGYSKAVQTLRDLVGGPFSPPVNVKKDNASFPSDTIEKTDTFYGDTSYNYSLAVILQDENGSKTAVKVLNDGTIQAAEGYGGNTLTSDNGEEIARQIKDVARRVTEGKAKSESLPYQGPSVAFDTPQV